MSGGKWGIERGAGWFEWEETRLARSRQHETTVPENGVVPTDLLVDRYGKPLIRREPRPLGFRQRGTGK